MKIPSISTRWTKLCRDLMAEKERVLMMLAAIAVSLAAVGAVLGGYAVLTREIAANYLGTHPASATLELPGGVDAEALAVARQHSGVRDVEARDVLLARAKVGEDWRPLLLFVVDDFSALRMNTFRAISGSWPPPPGTMLIERTAPAMLGADVGGKVKVKTAHGMLCEVPVSGSVHDPGLAPAWQERTGYGYISRATLGALGEAPILRELRISVDPTEDSRRIEATAASLARSLAAHGKEVHQIRVPTPRQHPHQKQMATTLFMMLAFSVLALVLSGILVATSLAAMLARQVREIGVMKALGATRGQLALLYSVLVAAIGAVAVLLAVPVGFGGAQVLARAIANLLNFTIADARVPAWVFGIQAAAGIFVPLAVASAPIRRASRLSVREAIDSYGVSSESLRVRAARLPWAVRNALRRPVRLAWTVGLLAAGGAIFMTALNISRSWERNIAKVYETRFYDVEVRFHEPQPDRIAQRVLSVPGVRAVEAWGYSPSAFSRPGEVDVMRTYPDRGHGSFSMMAPPPDTKLVAFPLRTGRWLLPTDTDAVVLNHSAAAQRPGLQVGDRIELSQDGKPTSWRLVGIVEEIGSSGAAYVTARAFAGTGGSARLLRVATQAGTPESRAAVIRLIELRLAEEGASVETAWPLAELRTAMGDHIKILIRSLVAMAAVMAIVGGLGLSATMGVSVLERTREFGVLKTLGATPARIRSLVLAEAGFIGAVSWITALALSIPITAWLDALIGNLGFVAPLPFFVSSTAVLIWLLLVGGVSLVATLVPARRASKTSVIQALAQV